MFGKVDPLRAHAVRPPGPPRSLLDKPGPWVDLALTLPIFLIYQLGVVGLEMDVRNGTDIFTAPLLKLVDYDQGRYLGLTFAIGAVFALVFGLLGRGRGFRASQLLQVVIEGVIYAVVMRVVAAMVVEHLPIGRMADQGTLRNIVLSCGAGFYEELAFRVILFGLVGKGLIWVFARQKVEVVSGAAPTLNMRALAIGVVWGLATAAFFSGIHYVGDFGDNFQLASFTFRMVLGLALTLIYATRGFAAAVWAHTLYDVWVMVL